MVLVLLLPFNRLALSPVAQIVLITYNLNDLIQYHILNGGEKLKGDIAKKYEQFEPFPFLDARQRLPEGEVQRKLF